MTPSPNLQDLIDIVRADAPSADVLELLSQASATANDLEQVTDALLGHFVDQCRRAGRSWSEISGALGVSKQAAHKRFSLSSPPTFERFTPRARAAVLTAAATQARRLGHGYVGTEHMLLALFESAESLAARVLSDAGITQARVEEQVIALVEPGTGLVTGELSVTDRAADALRGAAIEALEMGHNYIGTEHILLALFRDPNSVASKALSALGTGHDAVRSRTDELLAAYK
jgi:hypothetical protein